MIRKFIKNDSHRNENKNAPQDGQIWDSDEHECERPESDPVLYLHVIYTLHMIHAYQVTQIPMK